MPVTNNKSPQPRPRFERLEARISPEQKDLFKRAADLEGRTLTDFIVSCVVQEARRVVRENEIIKLSERDQQVFVESLLNPPPPNEALIAAMKRHDELIGESS